MFRVKICGITRAEDARIAINSGADAIGLNFVASSPRCLDLKKAQNVSRAIGRDAWKVGVFVDADVEAMLATATKLDLQAIQLHGNEPAEWITRLADYPVIRAYRYSSDRFELIRANLQECIRSHVRPTAVLIDAYHPSKYGGTGETVDWLDLGPLPQILGDIPLILAGGLGPANVAEAIAAVNPHGVDTASGVECSPGEKDPRLVKQFVDAARQALRKAGQFN